MMYHNKLVATISVNGKVVRETGDTVALPFGSEYSIRIKNLNSVRAMVKVHVNGQDATEDRWLVVQPNSTLELERFISNGNLETGNRFKFIERTEQIERHRGITEDDGLVRIEYKFEKLPEPVYNCWNNLADYTLFKSSGPYSGPATIQCNTTVTRGLTSSGSTMTSSFAPQAAGITVPGSKSNQKFYNTSWFNTESASHVLVIRLVGATEKAAVTKPIYVRDKVICPTCGKHNKGFFDYCPRCGTAIWQMFDKQ